MSFWLYKSPVGFVGGSRSASIVTKLKLLRTPCDVSHFLELGNTKYRLQRMTEEDITVSARLGLSGLIMKTIIFDAFGTLFRVTSVGSAKIIMKI